MQFNDRRCSRFLRLGSRAWSIRLFSQVNIGKGHGRFDRHFVFVIQHIQSTKVRTCAITFLIVHDRNKRSRYLIPLASVERILLTDENSLTVISLVGAARLARRRECHIQKRRAKSECHCMDEMPNSHAGFIFLPLRCLITLETYTIALQMDSILFPISCPRHHAPSVIKLLGKSLD